MKSSWTNDFDQLAARLHARRSGMYENARLSDLSRVATISELAARLGLKPEPSSTSELERLSAVKLRDEILFVREHLSGGEARAVDWLLMGLFVENLKVLIRGRAAGRSLAELKEHLLPLPAELQTCQPIFDSVSALEDFPAALPEGALRAGVLHCAAFYVGQRSPFFLETAMDRAFLAEALVRCAGLRRDDREAIWPLLAQAADMFHLKLATRGKFVYGVAPAALWPLHVPGTLLAASRFRAMLAPTEVFDVAKLALHRAIDSLPPKLASASAQLLSFGIAQLEALAWSRFQRLANRAFRSHPIGFGAVFSYLALRRGEVANLRTLAEAIRLGVSPETRMERFLPRLEMQVSHA